MNSWSISKAAFAAVAVAALAAGCWSFGRSEYPALAVTRVPAAATNVTVAVTGFEATITDYQTIYGTSMVYVPGYCGYRHYYPGFYDVQTTTYTMPQLRVTDMFSARARDSLEDAGFVIARVGMVADYVIDVRFSGPLETEGYLGRKLGWLFGTLFFCDYEAEGWSAKLRIRDNRTGKVLLAHEYRQEYQAKSFGLLPLFSAPSNHELGSTYVQTWCLSALTDRVVADASAFIVAQSGGK